MSLESQVPDWVTRGKSIAQLIRELQSFEDQSIEVRISTEDNEAHFPISLVGKQRGDCVLMSAVKSHAPGGDAIVHPDQLDALVAAPNHHKLLFETDLVRVLETRIAPGDRTPVHTHCWPGVLYFLSRSAFVRRDGEGNVMLDSRTLPPGPNPPAAAWTPPFPPHSLENVGDTEIHVIAVELKKIGV